jgi:hypothetical protein
VFVLVRRYCLAIQNGFFSPKLARKPGVECLDTVETFPFARATSFSDNVSSNPVADLPIAAP